MTWSAEQWRGKVTRCELRRAPVPMELREQGLTARDIYPEPRAHCAICGAGLLHYWEMRDAAGQTLIVGDECATIATGGPTPAQVNAEHRRRRVDEAWRHQQAAEAAERRNWWRAAEQRRLRELLVLGAREERVLGGATTYFVVARQAARAGRLSPAWRAAIERLDDGRAAASRAWSAMMLAMGLMWVHPGRYDRDIIADMVGRITNDDGPFTGVPVSQKQLDMLRRLAHRYRRQWAERVPQWRPMIEAAMRGTAAPAAA